MEKVQKNEDLKKNHLDVQELDQATMSITNGGSGMNNSFMGQALSLVHNMHSQLTGLKNNAKAFIAKSNIFARK